MKSRMIALYDYNLETVIVFGTSGVFSQEQVEKKFFDVYNDFHTRENIIIFREVADKAFHVGFGEHQELVEIENKNKTNKVCFQVVKTSEETANKDYFTIQKNIEERTNKMRNNGVLEVIVPELDTEDL